MDYASELAEIITLIYNKEIYFFGGLRKRTLPKLRIITFNEMSVLKPFGI
jgi:uroporphyrinogen-III synthase